METNALKPTCLPEAPVEHRGAERAALADEADVAGPRHAGGEGGVDAR